MTREELAIVNEGRNAIAERDELLCKLHRQEQELTDLRYFVRDMLENGDLSRTRASEARDLLGVARAC